MKAAEPLSTFLQYLKYGYMIDNIVLMVTGAMHEREVTVNASFFFCSLLSPSTFWKELLDKCHPLGMFDSIASLGAVSNLRYAFLCRYTGQNLWLRQYRELHRIVLVDTPISAYFGECFRDENLDEVNIEILRNSLYKVTPFILTCFELIKSNRHIWKIFLNYRRRSADWLPRLWR